MAITNTHLSNDSEKLIFEIKQEAESKGLKLKKGELVNKAIEFLKANNVTASEILGKKARK